MEGCLARKLNTMMGCWPNSAKSQTSLAQACSWVPLGSQPPNLVRSNRVLGEYGELPGEPVEVVGGRAGEPRDERVEGWYGGCCGLAGKGHEGHLEGEGRSRRLQRRGTGVTF